MKSSAAPRALLSKVKAPAALARILRQAARQKRRAVFTNGCFDLLHKGHVTYLERARRLGDLLVVAVNSDASVRRLKGKSRPLNPLADRLEVLAALECVDYVTWFTQDDPVALIRQLKPLVLVKGGDWKPAQILGGADVKSWGGKVRSLKFVPGRSTTDLIKRAQSRT